MIRKFKSCRTIFAGIAALLIFAGFILGTAFSTFTPPYFMHSDMWLFNEARTAQINGRWADAARYLTAYIERDPGFYRPNTRHKADVDNSLKKNLDEIGKAFGNSRIALEYYTLLSRCLVDNDIHDRFTMTASSPPGVLRPAPEQVLLFGDFNFSGPFIVKSLGRVDWIEQAGLTNDILSSVMIGENVKLIVCDQINMGPPCTTFTADDNNLSNDAIGNDRASSFEVVRR